MTTYRELVYMILEKAKGLSDDFSYTEEHIMYLLNKYRPLVLKQRYTDVRKGIPGDNYQTIILPLEEDTTNFAIYKTTTIKSIDKVPDLMLLGVPQVYSKDYFESDITLISSSRMKYVGHNKYLKNIIYAAIGIDDYLYFHSVNPQYKYLKKVYINAIFQNADDAFKLGVSDTSILPIDRVFAIDATLITPLIRLILIDILGDAYRPTDSDNNAKDDLTDKQQANANGRTQQVQSQPTQNSQE